MNFPHSARLGVCSALALSLLLSVPAVAGEPLPVNHNLVDASEVFLLEYIKRSRETLLRFDDLTKRRHFYPQKEWVDKSKSMQADLSDTWRKAMDKQMQLRNKRPPIPPVKQWYDQEVANWKNIETIGATLIAQHGDLVTMTMEIETWRLDELVKNKSRAEAMAGQITFYMVAIIEALGKGNEFLLPSHDVIADTFKAVDGNGDRMSPIAGALEILLVRQEASVKKFAQSVNDKKFKDNFARLESMKIDSDQSGEYYKHERIWESNLKDHVSRFYSAYDKYKAVATPFLVQWIEADLKKASPKIANWFKWHKGDKYEQLDESVAKFIKDTTDEVKKIEQRVIEDERKH